MNHHNQEDPERGCIMGLIIVVAGWIIISGFIYFVFIK